MISIYVIDGQQAETCGTLVGKGASIYDVRTEGEGGSPKEDVVREVA